MILLGLQYELVWGPYDNFCQPNIPKHIDINEIMIRCHNKLIISLYTNLSSSFTWQKRKINLGANQNASFLLR